jgi:hypothetical protein
VAPFEARPGPRLDGVRAVFTPCEKTRSAPRRTHREVPGRPVRGSVELPPDGNTNVLSLLPFFYLDDVNTATQIRGALLGWSMEP